MTICPRCATPREGARYCPSCGFDYWADAAVTTCPRCQAARSGTLPICPSCGYDYRTAVPAAVGASAAPSKTSRPSRLAYVLVSLVFLVVIIGAAVVFYSQVHNAQQATDSAIASYAATPVIHVITGSLVLTDTAGLGISASGGTCQGADGYSDLAPGVSVILKDENGTVIGSTVLGEGTGTSTTCTFAFSLSDVPDTAKFYVITVSHRGDVSDSHDQLAANGWDFSLTMGK